MPIPPSLKTFIPSRQTAMQYAEAGFKNYTERKDRFFAWVDEHDEWIENKIFTVVDSVFASPRFSDKVSQSERFFVSIERTSNRLLTPFCLLAWWYSFSTWTTGVIVLGYMGVSTAACLARGKWRERTAEIQFTLCLKVILSLLVIKALAQNIPGALIGRKVIYMQSSFYTTAIGVAVSASFLFYLRELKYKPRASQNRSL